LAKATIIDSKKILKPHNENKLNAFVIDDSVKIRRGKKIQVPQSGQDHEYKPVLLLPNMIK
jgi:hypothetical protein